MVSTMRSSTLSFVDNGLQEQLKHFEIDIEVRPLQKGPSLAQYRTAACFQKYFTSKMHGARERGIRCLFNFDFLAVLGHFQPEAPLVQAVVVLTSG